MIELTRQQKFLKFLVQVIPHHLVSRVVYFATRLRGPVVKPMINWFINSYSVDMREAEYPEIEHYETFNEFFTCCF